MQVGSYRFNELKSNTQPRLNMAIGTSIGGAAIICAFHWMIAVPVEGTD